MVEEEDLYIHKRTLYMDKGYMKTESRHIVHYTGRKRTERKGGIWIVFWLECIRLAPYCGTTVTNLVRPTSLVAYLCVIISTGIFGDTPS